MERGLRAHAEAADQRRARVEVPQCLAARAACTAARLRCELEVFPIETL